MRRAAPLTIYRASLETVNYEFEAYGSTAHHARSATPSAVIACNAISRSTPSRSTTKTRW
jgi:hypothetical protein